MVPTGAGLLQREVRHLRASGHAVLPQRLQLGSDADEHGVRNDDVHRRLRMLQLELQHLRAFRRNVRQDALQQIID